MENKAISWPRMNDELPEVCDWILHRWAAKNGWDFGLKFLGSIVSTVVALLVVLHRYLGPLGRAISGPAAGLALRYAQQLSNAMEGPLARQDAVACGRFFLADSETSPEFALCVSVCPNLSYLFYLLDIAFKDEANMSPFT